MFLCFYLIDRCMYCIGFWEPVNHLILMFIALYIYKLYVILTQCGKIYVTNYSIIVSSRSWYIKLYFVVGNFSKSTSRGSFEEKFKESNQTAALALMIGYCTYCTDSVLYHEINKPLLSIPPFRILNANPDLDPDPAQFTKSRIRSRSRLCHYT